MKFWCLNRISSWRSRSITPQNFRDFNQGGLHLLSEFGGSSLYRGRVLTMAMKELRIDTQTHGHTTKRTHTRTDGGNDITRMPQVVSGKKSTCNMIQSVRIMNVYLSGVFIWKSIMFIFTFGAITLWRNAQKNKRIWRDRWDSKRKINCYGSTRLLKGTIPRLHIRLGMINHITMWEMLSTQKPPDRMAFYFKTKIYSYTLSL